ncbi:MAG: deoxyribonuclease V [Desulfuromonadales bacterium]|nr:deoxyribonuclease V [Desulfuromonadales bacterium]
MQFADLHTWDLPPKQAVAIQTKLADRIVLRDMLPKEIILVAGVDVSYQRRAERFHAAVVLMELETASIIETATASAECDFPYIPGLLSFRELPVLLQAFRKLQTVPEVVLVDGQGIAHPRRFGLASHLGLWLDLPTIGCAKSRLCGEAAEPARERGSWTSLSCDGKAVGAVVRTRQGVRPMYISPGHLVSIDRAVEIVLRCGGGYRLPEPTRQAHLASNRLRVADELSVAESFGGTSVS